MSKLLVVFGATGNQGGSVVKAVLADQELSKQFRIRAVTRDVAKPAAKALSEQGVEVVAADLKQADTVAEALKGADTVFLVTNFWEYMSQEKEIEQGKTVTDAAKAAGVKHFIFSSLLNASKVTNGRLTRVAHFDGKAIIEDYIRQSGLEATFVQPGFFMSGLFNLISKTEDGSYMLTMPIPGDTPQIPLHDAVGDTGKFVKAAIKSFPKYSGKHILAAADYYTPQQIVSQFSEVIGKPAKFLQVPQDTYKSFLPPPVANELLEMMLLIEEPGYFAGADLTESQGLLDEKPTSWKDFASANKEQWA